LAANQVWFCVWHDGSSDGQKLWHAQATSRSMLGLFLIDTGYTLTWFMYFFAKQLFSPGSRWIPLYMIKNPPCHARFTSFLESSGIPSISRCPSTCCATLPSKYRRWRVVPSAPLCFFNSSKLTSLPVQPRDAIPGPPSPVTFRLTSRPHVRPLLYIRGLPPVLRPGS
jgi:hypothetical protein